MGKLRAKFFLDPAGSSGHKTNLLVRPLHLMRFRVGSRPRKEAAALCSLLSEPGEDGN